MYFSSHHEEEFDLLKAEERVNRQLQQYESTFKQNEGLVQKLSIFSDYYPEVTPDIAIPYVLAGGDVSMNSAREIAQDITDMNIENDTKLWNEMVERYQYEGIESRMKMSYWDLLSGGLAPGGAKPGDVQYGVWAFAALDGLFQTFGPSGKWSLIGMAANKLLPGQPMSPGRSAAYLRDLKEYDRLLQDGYTPAGAQKKLQIQVQYTEVEDIGKDTNLIGDMKKHIAMIKEAHGMGGEAIIANMFRMVTQGKPINFDRGTKIMVESIKAENTPMYAELTRNHGMSPQAARDYIYSHIGKPIKNFDEKGQIFYTSNYKPNRVNFYAGRRNHSFFIPGFMDQDTFRPEWSDDDTLLEYSPGKVHASEFYAPGTKAFNTVSGILDASYQILPEIFAGKGVRQFKSLSSAFVKLNDVSHLHQLGVLHKQGKVLKVGRKAYADEVYEAIDDAIRTTPVEKDIELDKLRDLDRSSLENYVKPYYKYIKAAEKELKKKHTFYGRVPRFFQATLDDIIYQPMMRQFANALAKTDHTHLSLLESNPILGNIDSRVLREVTGTEVKKGIDDPEVILQMFKDMLDGSGYAIKDAAGNVAMNPGGIQAREYLHGFGRQLPIKGSFVLSKLSQNAANKGTKLKQSKSAVKRTIGKGLATVGDENAAYKSLGGYLGTRGNQLREILPSPIRNAKRRTMIKSSGNTEDAVDTMDIIGRKIIRDPSDFKTDKYLDWERYLGFSSAFNSGYDPYFRKLLGFIPEMGIPLAGNFNVGMKQLATHLQINGYNHKQASKIMHEFMDLDHNSPIAIRDFTRKLATVYDVDHVAARGGDWEEVAEIANDMWKNFDRETLYLVGDGVSLPHLGGGKRMSTLIDPQTGNLVEVTGETAHIQPQMTASMAPLMDYRVIKSAVGKMRHAYRDDYGPKQAVRNTFGDGVDFMKFMVGWEGTNPYRSVDEAGNVITKGFINQKTLEQDFFTNLANLYTRSIFKPFVLGRAAFLTRVFLEEQAGRMMAAGMDTLFNAPHRMLGWMLIGQTEETSRTLRVLNKLGADLGAKSEDGIRILTSIEAQQATYQTFKPSIWGEGNPISRAKLNYLAGSKSQLGNERYVQQIGMELLLLRQDQIARKVAELGYDSPEMWKWLESTSGSAARRDMHIWGGDKWEGMLDIASDDLKLHLASIEATLRIKAGGKFDKTRELIKQADGTYKYNLDSTRTGDKSIFDAIAHGRLANHGEVYDDVRKLKQGQYVDFNETDMITGKFFNKRKLDKQLDNYYGVDGMDGGWVKYTEPIAEKKAASMADWVKQADDWLQDTFYQAIFDRLITKPIGFLNRSPVFHQYRWAFVSQRFADFSPRVRKQFIKQAQDEGVPNKVIKELKGKDLLIGKSSKANIDDFIAMENESKAFGLAGVKQLLYDTQRKHEFSDKFRNIFPFMEVWFEVFSTWGRLLSNNPYILRKGQVTVRGMSSADSLGGSSEDGFFIPSPVDASQDLFVFPFGGYMGNVVLDADPADSMLGKLTVDKEDKEDQDKLTVSPRGFLRGINLLGQGFVPGPNPMVAFALNKVLPETGLYGEFREFLFGDFPPPEELKETVAVAPVYTKLRACLLDPDEFEDVAEGSNAQKIRAKATIDIFRWGVASGHHKELLAEGKLDTYLMKIYGDRADFDRSNVSAQQLDTAYLEYAKEASGRMCTFQFIYQFFGPTSFKPEYFINDEEGNQWGQSVLYQEYTRILEKHNGDSLATYAEFFELYDIEHPYITSPTSLSVKGKVPSSVRVQEFQKENSDIFDTLEISGYYLNVDNPNEDKDYFDVVKQKTLLGSEQYQKSINETIGVFRYKTYARRIDRSDLSSEGKRVLKKLYREELKLALPGFQSDEYGLPEPPSSQDIFDEMREWWPNLGSIQDYEAVKGFNSMLPYWQEAESISASLSKGSTTWWLSSSDIQAAALRLWIFNEAQRIIKEYPDFYPVWQGVMLKLYRDDQEILNYIPPEVEA